MAVSGSVIDKIAVIMPCAGEGTRLGLPYPKELHIVAKNHALMDFSVAHCIAYREQVEKLVITLVPKKHMLVEFMKKHEDAFDIVFTFFKHGMFEWPGSILSARGCFSNYNMVLLPDSNLKAHPDYPLVPTMIKMLQEYDVVFGYCTETRPERLRVLGALQVDGSNVLKFADKPQTGHESYNAFWTTFAFRKEVAADLLSLMMQSVQKQAVNINNIGKIGAFPVASYEDMGVWPNIHKFMTDGEHNQLQDVGLSS